MRTAARIALSTGLAVVAAGGLVLAGIEAGSRVRTGRPSVGARERSALETARLDAWRSEPVRAALRTQGPGSDALPNAADQETEGWRPAALAASRGSTLTAAEDDDFGSEPSARREAPQPNPKRIALDPIRISDGGLALQVTGHDARGPRDLVLWRIHAGAAAVVARGRSRRDGALDFPRLVAPRHGLVLVATPAWETPDGPRASPARIVAPRAATSPPTAGGGRRGTAVRGSEERAALARNDR